MVFKHKKQTIFLALGSVALLAIVAITITFTTPQNSGTSSSASSIIKGLHAQNSVSYKIFRADQSAPIIGKIAPSKDGTIALPALHHAHKGNIAYDLEIKTNNKDTANILIRYDHKQNKYKLSATGLGNFQDVAYGMNGKSVKSKTDWAGIFQETELKPNQTKNHNQINFAFSTINAHDGININPSIIKIELEATGGGVGNTTPKDPKINKYKTSGDPALSVNFHRSGLDHVTKSIVKNMVTPMMMMTEQLSAVMFQHIMIVGTMIDADIQMDTQRDFQRLQAEAMRDYHPSEQMCVIGTFARSLHNAESRADFNKIAYSEIMTNRYTLEKNSSAAKGFGSETRGRLKVYKDKYCNPADNNSGLSTLCKTAIPDKARTNKDINYPLTILKPLTLDVDFTDNAKLNDEEDIIELGKNLYWFHPFSAVPGKDVEVKRKALMDSRRLMAMHNVASTTLSSIIGQKSKAFKSGQGKNSGVFMKKLIEMLLPTTGGTPPPSPTDILGEDPSYYAMMEVLTKKMYQDGNFYTNLYDKPANIDRVKVSLGAIQLMHNRDRYESMIRREMLSSLLLEAALYKEQNTINAQMERISAEQ